MIKGYENGGPASGVNRLRRNGFANGGGIMPPQNPVPEVPGKTAPVTIQQTGLVPVADSGRSDSITANIPADSNIIPADIVSALGDGNTAAGGRILDGVLGLGENAQQPMQPPQQGPGIMPAKANGGPIAGKSQAPQMVTIRISGGEYAVMPEDVARRGGGDLEHGHEVINEFVKNVRADYAKKIKSLPGPRK